ncbi:hypothetical protein FOS14_07765 [Skermania sp. ID1734]|uniref:hypothetical protein n=1 Tax=Skermania sp. ID1734 TaxID=2597516 RepID=UPI00117CB5C8|nr:hypothetical protein [Skermania sp. ID1734]TSE00317.1 hypothetical protein FOS14_07765 [Skermania sp. ID1734]
MARGEHPQRTPFYGALMMVAAWISSGLATAYDAPAAVRYTIYGISVPVVAIGFLMTFRDLS